MVSDTVSVAGDPGQINVKVGMLPGRIGKYQLASGSTVRDALSVAGLEADAEDVRVNGQPVQLDQPLATDATVAVLKRTRGN